MARKLLWAKCFLLPSQQPAFGFHAVGESAKALDGGHPMAGNEQQQGIAANGLAYGTRRRGGLQG